MNIKEGNNFSDIIENISDFPNIRSWIGEETKWNKITINAEQGAGQLRRLGRVYFAANVTNNKNNSFNTVLSQVYQNVISRSHDNSQTTYHILAGLSGGTGSGTIVDAISLVSDFINNKGNTKDKILIYSLLPSRNEESKDPLGFYYPNTYAALKEINAIGLFSENENNPHKYNPININNTTHNNQIDNYSRINAKFDTCFLFSYENENNKIIDNKKALPDLVGDYLYHSIINLPQNHEGHNAYIKLTENTLIEAEVDKFSGSKERAIKFASASLKRIEIPEIEIIDYYGAKIALQFVLQQKFNNWVNEQGYQNELGEDQTSDFVFNRNRNDNFLAECEIALEYLSLKTPHDTDYQKADDIWDTNSKILLENAFNVYTNGEEKLPILYFNKYMDIYFNSQFRGVGIGVEKYWNDKTNDLLQQSKYFFDKIEKKLLDYWVSCNDRVVGLEEISKIIKNLIEELQKISNQASNRIKHLQNPEDFNPIDADYTNAGCNKEIGKLIKEFGQLIKFRNSKTIVAEAAQFITKLYKNKTDIIAYEFAIKNIAELIKKLENLSAIVDSIKVNLYESTDFLNNIITEKRSVFENRNEKESHQSANVKMLYKKESIDKDFKIILNQKSSIQKVLTNFRRSIVNAINAPTFQSLSEYLNEDKIKTQYLYDLNSKVPLLYHELEQENLIKSTDKLVGRNVLDYFRNEYSNEKLKEYFAEVKKETGVSVKLSNIKNDTLDEIKLKTYANELYVIQIPTYRVDESAEKYEKYFVSLLKEIFGEECEIILNSEGNRNNEITIFKAKKQMALRSFDMVAGMLHEKYQNLINNNNDWTDIVIHTEGTYRDYPKIIPFKDSEKEKAWDKIFDEELLPYILIGIQTEHVQKNKKQEFIFLDDVSSLTAKTTILSEKESSLYEIKNYIFEIDILSMKKIEDRIGNHIINIINKFIIQKDNKKNYSNWLEQVEKQTLNDILKFDYENDKSNPEYQKILTAFEKVQKILKY